MILASPHTTVMPGVRIEKAVQVSMPAHGTYTEQPFAEDKFRAHLGISGFGGSSPRHPPEQVRPQSQRGHGRGGRTTLEVVGATVVMSGRLASALTQPSSSSP